MPAWLAGSTAACACFAAVWVVVAFADAAAAVVSFADACACFAAVWAFADACACAAKTLVPATFITNTTDKMNENSLFLIFVFPLAVLPRPSFPKQIHSSNTLTM